MTALTTSLLPEIAGEQAIQEVRDLPAPLNVRSINVDLQWYFRPGKPGQE